MFIVDTWVESWEGHLEGSSEVESVKLVPWGLLKNLQQKLWWCPEHGWAAVGPEGSRASCCLESMALIWASNTSIDSWCWASRGLRISTQWLMSDVQENKMWCNCYITIPIRATLLCGFDIKLPLRSETWAPVAAFAFSSPACPGVSLCWLVHGCRLSICVVALDRSE